MLKMSLLFLLFGAVASAQYATFALASKGCPQAHCSNFAGAWVNDAPPKASLGTPTLTTSDTDAGNSDIGLGCVSNGTFVACSYHTTGLGVCTALNPHNNLVIYSWAGGSNALVPIYQSKCLFDDSSFTSVPMIDNDGDVIMSDDHVIARIDYDTMTSSYPAHGSYTWCQTLQLSGATTSCAGAGAYASGGDSISPILLNNGYVVALGTKNPGWIYAFYVDTGTPVGPAIQVLDTGSNTYETLNTPAASYNYGTRFYLTMSGIHSQSDALLAAIDVDTSTIPGTITNTWQYTDAAFNCTCGASPAVVPDPNNTSHSVIYFDGSGYIFSVEDTGPSGAFYWTSGVPTLLSGMNVQISGSIDSGRNCLWVGLWAPRRYIAST